MVGSRPRSADCRREEGARAGRQSREVRVRVHALQHRRPRGGDRSLRAWGGRAGPRWSRWGDGERRGPSPAAGGDTDAEVGDVRPCRRRVRGPVRGPHRRRSRRHGPADPGSAGFGEDLLRRRDDLRAREGGQEGRRHRDEPQGHPEPAGVGAGGAAGQRHRSCGSLTRGTATTPTTRPASGP